jgi:hypothetical protein
MKVTGALLGFASAAMGPASIEFQVANVSNAGFTGQLKVFIGRNCNTNVTSGRICDYKFQGSVSYSSNNQGYRFYMPDQVDPDNDMIFMTYRSSNEAIFSSIRMDVNLSTGTRIIDLMNFEGGKDNYLVFDYDSRAKPCNSSYPRGSQCIMDATFDLYTKKLKPHYSLLRGRVIKRSSPPELPTIKASSQLKLTTGGSAYDGSDDPIEIYYGKDCNANNCVYSKVGSLTPPNRDTTYSVWLPEFDYANDQLIIDYRSGDDLYIKGLTFDACTATSCRNYNLLAFGSSVTQRIAMDYEGPDQPCSNFSYGDYVCQYDMVFDFKVMRKYADSSTLVGR